MSTFLKKWFEEMLDNPMAKLKMLQETKGITQYNEMPEFIRTKEKLSEQYLISAYLAGLQMDTQMHHVYENVQPQTVRQLGKLYKKVRTIGLWYSLYL